MAIKKITFDPTSGVPYGANLTIYGGATFKADFNIVDTSNAAYDFSGVGWTAKSEMVKSVGVGATTVADARFAKPLDQKLIMDLCLNHEILITIEEGSIGGFGSHVAKFLSEKNLLDNGLKFRSMILPDKFIDQDKPELMYKLAALDSDSIEERVINLLNSNIVLQKQK